MKPTVEQTWHIQLFGGLQASRDGLIVTHFPTRKTAALLAWLALHPGPAHSREVLAEMLWPDEEPDAVRDRFRQALAALRRALEPEVVPGGSVLLADRMEVRLNRAGVQTDVEAFETALSAASGVQHPDMRLAHLLQAIDLYRGELLPGYYEDWMQRERYRLADRYRGAMREAAELLARRGEIDHALSLARRAVEADPLQEEAHAQVMRLYAQAGRLTDAARQYHQLERILQEQIGQAPAAATRRLLEQLQEQHNVDAEGAGMSTPVAAPPPAANHPAREPAADSTVSAAQLARTGSGRTQPIGELAVSGLAVHPMSPVFLEPEGGAVPLESNFYLVRPTDEGFAAAVTRGDSIVRVKGARHTGKTSLLARGLQQARQAGAGVLLTDMQKFTPAQMETADHLFRVIADAMIDALALDLDLDALWKPDRGWNVNFERFLRRQVLGQLDAPLVWGLDEVDRLFGFPYSADVFGLFRSWHNERSLDPTGPWSKLTLAIAYATEAHLFITDLNQSPFNVGTRLTLVDFTLQEVAEMNRRYGSPLRTAAETARLYDLVGGNPYLVRRSLNALVTERQDIDTLELQSDREDGAFTDPLRRMLTALRQDKMLLQAVILLLKDQPCPSTESFYRLRSAGLVIGATLQEARFRCRLYRSYLEAHLP